MKNKYLTIQVKFDISNHPHNLAELWLFFDLVFVGVLILVFHSITFAGMLESL